MIQDSARSDARPASTSSGFGAAAPTTTPALLGEDFDTWREAMRNGYLRFYMVHAVVQSGVADELRRRGPAGATAPELAAATSLDAELLEPVLTYLSFADRVLSKQGDRFALGERGAWLFEPELQAQLLASVDAYGCILTELLPALRKEKRYGQDFRRRGDAVAAASLLVTRPNYPFIIDMLRQHGVPSVADLGCGAAGLLVEFCRLDPGLHGVGIDIDQGSLSEARRAVADVGYADRITLIEGDIARPDSFAGRPEMANVRAFNCCGVLHELFRDGEEAVIRVLREYKRLFPGRYFFLGEFRARTDKEYGELPILKRTRHLWYQHIMHPLSRQGSPQSREQWLAIFAAAGIEFLGVKDSFVDQYVLRL